MQTLFEVVFLLAFFLPPAAVVVGALAILAKPSSGLQGSRAANYRDVAEHVAARP